MKVSADYAFTAGQYLLVHHHDGRQIPLSIASAPSDLPLLDLHYQPTAGDPLSQAMDECLEDTVVNISAPAGKVRCPDPEQSLLIVAGGSGASLAFCCSAHRRTLNPTCRTSVLWCVDQAGDFYSVEQLTAWSDLTCIADDRRGPENSGLKALAGMTAYSNYILSGSPGFVYAATDLLLASGVDPGCMQSDVYDYAPREAPLRNTGSSGSGKSGKPPTERSR